MSGAPAPESNTIASLLSGHPAEQIALVAAGPDRQVSFAELRTRIDRLSRLLAALGVDRGARVALAVPDGPDFLQVLLAVMQLGAIAAPLNPAYTEDEFEFYLSDLAPSILVLTKGSVDPARAAVANRVVIADIVGQPGNAPGLEIDGAALHAEAEFRPAGSEDAALLLHTSGTTSAPKQVPLLQRNLTISARNIATFYELTPSDVSYCAMPLFHVHGLVASTLGALAGGGTVVVPERFSSRLFWDHVRAYRVTWFSAGPTLHQMILERSDGEGPPPDLRFVRSCSSALPAALMQRCEEAYGAPMLEAYGMTEASHQIASNPLPPAERFPGSVGIPAGADVRIFDTSGRPLPDGAPGEVVIRGPGVIRGYLGNSAADADAFYDGWFRTGDIGVVDGGRLRLEGRIKELINRGGEKISPYEVEAVLLRHEAVADAVCFGLPDAMYGEVVAVAVVLNGEADAEDMRAYCSERLAAFKVPQSITIVETIPRTVTGKLQRKRVGAQLGLV